MVDQRVDRLGGGGGAESLRETLLLVRAERRHASADLVGPERAGGADALRDDEDGGRQPAALELGQRVLRVVAPAVVESDRAGAGRQRSIAGDARHDLVQGQHAEVGLEPREMTGERLRRHVHPGQHALPRGLDPRQDAVVHEHRGAGAIEEPSCPPVHPQNIERERPSPADRSPKIHRVGS